MASIDEVRAIADSLPSALVLTGPQAGELLGVSGATVRKAAHEAGMIQLTTPAGRQIETRIRPDQLVPLAKKLEERARRGGGVKRANEKRIDRIEAELADLRGLVMRLRDELGMDAKSEEAE